MRRSDALTNSQCRKCRASGFVGRMSKERWDQDAFRRTKVRPLRSNTSSSGGRFAANDLELNAQFVFDLDGAASDADRLDAELALPNGDRAAQAAIAAHDGECQRT